jgi:ketosteroid isomerase-like protein
MKKLHLLIIILLLINSSNIFSQQSEEIKTLTQLLHNFLEGASNNDREIHDNFWAEDLIYTSSNGTRFGKAEIMAGFENETELADTPKTIFTAEDIQVNVYGDMAVVAFKMKGTNGEEVQYYFNSGTFLRRNGNWQVVNWQATRVPH